MEGNLYLVRLGSQLVEIRRLLGWRQQDLAIRLGVSRPVLVNIENNPYKMTRNVALALFTVVVGEIEVRRKNLKQIDFNDADSVKLALEKLGLTSKVMSTILPGLGFAIGGIVGAGIAGGIGALSSLLLFKNHDKKNEAIIDEKIKPTLEKAVDLIEQKIMDSMGLKSLEITEFFKNLDQQYNEKGND